MRRASRGAAAAAQVTCMGEGRLKAEGQARGVHHCRSPICSWSLYSTKSSGARTRRQSSHVQLKDDSMVITGF